MARGPFPRLGAQVLDGEGEQIGTITSGAGGIDLLGGEVLGSDTLVRAIRAARTDDSIRAIVLRIDSPGGSAVASDVIWREVMLAKADKPVIASMSDLGASGGYYIAMAADTIVAQPATLTGSIGVVGGKITTGGTYQKVGITIEGVSNGRFAGMYSPVTPFSDDERAKMQEHIDAIYEQFLTKAAEGRNTTRDAIHEVAQGRVWTGRQAKERGLVDELGGLGRAIALAKERVGIEADAEVELVVYPRPKSLFELLRGGFTVAQAAARLGWLPFPPARAPRTNTSPRVMAAAMRKVPASMRSGMTSWSKPSSAVRPSISMIELPAPSTTAPMLTSASARSTTSGSRAAFSIRV